MGLGKGFSTTSSQALFHQQEPSSTSSLQSSPVTFLSVQRLRATISLPSPSQLPLVGQAYSSASARSRVFITLVGLVLLFTMFRLVYVGSVGDSSLSGDVNVWNYNGLQRRLPQCIVIGIRKCGTRALLEFINLHPQVKVAQDEMHFFDKEENYKQGLEWYRSRMPLSYPGQLTLEKTPGYFIKPEAPSRIHHMNSSIKILLIVREPVVRTISDYTQVYSKRLARNAQFPHFEELVIDANSGMVNTDYKPVQISTYYNHWRRWLKHFARSQIHIVDGDKLLTEPLSELRRVEQFLGLDHYLSQNNFYFNETRGFYCVRNQTQSRCLGASKGRHHPKVNRTVIQKLKDYLEPYNTLFFISSGKQFNWNSKTI